jgi:hypothetical protein
VATRARLLVFVIVAFGTTACDHKPDALRRATDCLYENQARVAALPPAVTKLTARSRWSYRRFLIADNGLNVVSTPTDAGAAEAYGRANEAQIAVDPARPAPVRQGRIVYYWDAPPSPAERAVVRRCLGD